MNQDKDPPPPGPAQGNAARRGASNLAKMLGGRFGAQILLAISVFVIARRLGAERYGIYAGVLAVAAILQAASTGGLQMVEARILSPLWRQGNRRQALTLASTIAGGRILLSALAALAAILWLGRSPELVQGPGVLALLGLFCFLRGSYETFRSLLLAVGQAGRLILFELIRAGATLPLVLGAYAIAGLNGVFAALPLFYGLLLITCLAVLRRTLPIRPGALRWSSLVPHLGYSFSSFLGSLATMVQAQFAVYALAHWVTGSAAAFLALAVQFFALGQGVVLTGQRALLPILAELEAAGEEKRLAGWGSRMLRFGTAVATIGILVWALIGRDIIRWVLGPEFAPVHACVAWILVAALFYGLAEGANGLLYIRGLARQAFLCTFLFAAITIGGLVWILGQGAPDMALAVCRLYALAAGLYFLTAFLQLGLRGHLWLPIARVVALALPVAAAGPLLRAGLGIGTAWGLALLLPLLYMAGAVASGLLPRSEWRELLALLGDRGRKARN